MSAGLPGPGVTDDSLSVAFPRHGVAHPAGSRTRLLLPVLSLVTPRVAFARLASTRPGI